MEDKQSGGVFDQKPIKEDVPAASPIAEAPKENFKSPENQSQQQMPHKAIKENEDTKNLGSSSDADNVQEELEDLEKVSPEDLKLAEQLIFKGYAEKDIEMLNLPGNVFTICSTSAAEYDIIDEVVFDKVKGYETDDGKIDMPQNKLTALKTALMIAISYRGRNKEEICVDSVNHLNTIKNAIIKISEYQMLGEIKKLDELKESLKKSLLVRAIHIMKLPTQIIDFLSSEKLAFDSTMYRIMTTKKILPKS